MIARFLDQELVLSEIKKGKALKSGADHLDLIASNSHRTDLTKEIGAIWNLLDHVKTGEHIYDLMAGTGFSGKLFLKRFPQTHLVLNDMSSRCVRVLKENFPKQIVYETRADQVPIIRVPDLVFVDFNDFTLNRIKRVKDKINTWKSVFASVSRVGPLYFMFTDSACWGFKFKKNLQSYGCSNSEDYYYQLEDFLFTTYGWRISHVARFGPAALILCQPRIFRGKMEFVESTPTPIEFRKNEELW